MYHFDTPIYTWGWWVAIDCEVKKKPRRLSYITITMRSLRLLCNRKSGNLMRTHKCNQDNLIIWPKSTSILIIGLIITNLYFSMASRTWLCGQQKLRRLWYITIIKRSSGLLCKRKSRNFMHMGYICSLTICPKVASIPNWSQLIMCSLLCLVFSCHMWCFSFSFASLSVFV